MRLSLILPVLLSCASVSAQWALIPSSITPSARRAGAMAFDGATSRMLIYGGTSQTPSVALAENWNLLGSNWTPVPSAAPARWGHRMVRNPLENRILTFGGRSPTISGLSNDTMEWNGSTWATIPTSNAPSPRFLYGMCYDSTRGVYVLFGGRTLQGTNNETWEFNGITWNQVNPATVPPAREEMMMVFDTSLNRTILFGGCNDDTDTIYGDTWTFDGTDWALELSDNCAGCPTPRVRMAAAFDSDRQRTVMFGGYEEQADGTRALSNQTWEFTGDTWVSIPSATNPTNTTETYHAYDEANGRFVIYGGFGGTFSDEAWAYTGTPGGLFSLYGTGCETSVGLPTLTATTPAINQQLDFTFGNLPSEADIVAVVLGLSNTNAQGLPLPFNLTLLGLPSCFLLASNDLIEVAINFGGTATFGLPLPNQPSLVNQSIYVQGFPLDLDPFVFLGASRGGRALIGN